MGNAKVSTPRKNSAPADANQKKSSLMHNAVPGEPPTSDAGYLELLGYSIFSVATGNRKILDENWPEILYGFKNFHVQRVSEFTDQDLQDIGQRVAILRDKPQLPAMVVNATAILQISQVYGSFKRYLRSFEKDGPAELLKDISDRFKLVDRSVFQDFLKSAGAKILFPEPARPRKGGKQARSSRRGGGAGNQRHPKAGGGQPNNGKNKPTRGGKPGQPKAERREGEKGNGRGKGRRPRKRRFGFRKKKGTENSAKTEKTGAAAKD